MVRNEKYRVTLGTCFAISCSCSFLSLLFGWLADAFNDTRERNTYEVRGGYQDIKIHVHMYEYDVNVVFATWEVAEKLF